MRDTLRLGRIAGISVGVNWTFVVAFGLMAFVFANSQFPAQVPDLSTGAYMLAGVSSAALFVGSLLVHELAHAIVAWRNGVRVERVTLWFLGGVARLSGDPADPGADLRMASIGPLVTLVMAGAFFGLSTVLSAAAPGIVVVMLAWLGALNLLLAVFNIAPAAPLDGGRVLRALVWRKTGDRRHATEVAGRAGQGFGFLLVVLGLVAFMVLPGIGGLWLALIGGFITSAAGIEGQQARPAGALYGEQVADVMTPMPITVSGDLNVQVFIDKYIFLTPHSAFPVVVGERPVGLITWNRVKQLTPEQRDKACVADVACPLEIVPVAAPSEDAGELLPRINGCTDGRALVVEHDRLVGMVSARDIIRHLELVGLQPA